MLTDDVDDVDAVDMVEKKLRTSVVDQWLLFPSFPRSAFIEG